MPMLFCNIGWMENYQGKDGDQLTGGGSYNKTQVGHEVCNFSSHKGKLYGYVQPVIRDGVSQQIKLEKLGATENSDYIDGVTVVWTAPSPKIGGTVVIGWYEDARVYRHYQKIPSPSKIQIENGISHFRIEANADNSVLLPVKKRTFTIPRGIKGGIGQSNVWFAESELGIEIREQIQLLIDDSFSLPLSNLDFENERGGTEGARQLRQHSVRERNPRIIQLKKKTVLDETDRLACEACGFDFLQTYGSIGEYFCEVHHLKPLSKSDGVIETKLSDLAIVCSNCHRMIHKHQPMLSIAEISQIIQNQQKKQIK